MAEPTKDPLLTIKQLAHREGLTERRVRWLLEVGGLPHYDRLGIRIRWSEYLAWLHAGRRSTSKKA